MNRSWVVGWNRPAELPTTEPKAFDTWVEARQYLRYEIGEVFLVARDREDPEHRLMVEYMGVTGEIRNAKAHQPLSFVFDGLVWWLADVPPGYVNVTARGSAEPD